MATFKISQLPAVTSIAGTEELEVNQSSTSKKATASQLRAGLATSGAVTGSGLTMTTARMLGRTTASTGAIEEITVGTGLSLSGGTLTATGGGGGGGVTEFSAGTTGLTPATSTTGSVTLAGTLVVANGGTGATDASTARTNLGLAIGTNVQAYDVELAAIAGLTSAADQLPYFTGSGTAALTTFTAAGRALVDDADAAAQRTTLGLGTAATMTGPSGTIVGTTDTQTLTNKRVTPRIGTVADAATITPTADTADQYNVTALAQAATIAAPSGTPVDGQRLILRFEDNGTGRALTWTTSSGAYRAVGVTLPTTTVASKATYVGCIYNAQDVFWDVVAAVTQA
jgi:hypothetical protein